MAWGTAAAQEWDFDVSLDGKPIGSHRFSLTAADGDLRTLSSDAEFDVKLLFINAYSYRHQSRERWDGDCLVSVDAQTDDNGDRYRVEGELTDDGSAFRIARSGDDTLSPNETLPACAMTFAYWNPRMLEQSRLLNVQDGRYLAVDIEALGAETVQLGDRETRVERYRITAKDVDIELWYDAAGDWRYLKSRTPDDYEIVYRRR